MPIPFLRVSLPLCGVVVIAVGAGCDNRPAKSSLEEATPISVGSVDSHRTLKAQSSEVALNPRAALTEIAGASDSASRLSLAQTIAGSVNDGDSRGWLEATARLPFSESRDALLEALLTELASDQPELAMRTALAVEPITSSRQLMLAVAPIWADQDHHELFAFALGLPNDSFSQKLQYAAIHAWTALEPDAAFDHLAALDYDKGGISIWIPAQALSRRDPESALGRLDSIPDPEVWETAAGRIFETITQENLPYALEMFSEQTDPAVRRPLAYALGGTFADRSVADGVFVLNQIDDNESADPFLHGMIHRLRKVSLEPLLDEIPAIENPLFRQRAAFSTARELGERDPKLAENWLPTLLDEEMRAEAYQGVGMGYAKGNPVAAQAWLSSLPPGKDLRYAIFGFASEHASRDPSTSAAWALKIAEPDVRRRLASPILRRWAKINRAEAVAWANQQGYSSLLPPPSQEAPPP